ncbi:uncharacterized protein LOC113070271 [Carassius auratus]|uniref:Uncharacterized protein LOC113070271 n=1 Tax=Carassius auratus TaxID=7957 RepID=A0A6P6MT94_CARAU|nr:uncharacterized protein LOC113070271 [Carassius auratus]XP_026099301.1 uncharacterized protein LOC113070271 [Carassius auratus]XP_026099308.1 uncharacterized protein LOC113070271 [Carassius auratus]
MKKVLAIISLTACLCCCGVQSARPSNDELSQRIVNTGTVVFLDIVEKFRNTTEKLLRDYQFKKLRISVQGYMKTLREFAKQLNTTDSARESQDYSVISAERFFTFLTGVTFGATIREVFDGFFFPYKKIYSETLKNETVVDIWNEVESNYLPGAPPIYSKPMQFFSHLLAKAVVKSQLVNMLEAGVDTVIEIGKINFNQLHDDMQMVMDQIRRKAFEISILERQKEKNDFLISLRTASGVIVFYWDTVLEHTERASFHAKYLDSRKRWAELTRLRNPSEAHLFLEPVARGILKVTEFYFGEFYASQEYYRLGNATIGLDRFNQSIWAVVKSAVIYSLPVYEKLTKLGFGISEINGFLLRFNKIALILEGNDKPRRWDTHSTIESFPVFILFSLAFITDKEITNSKEIQLLLPLRVIRRVFLEFWNPILTARNETESQLIESKWIHLSNITNNELLKSNVFSRKQLEDAPKNFVEAIRRILEKLKQYTDLLDGFDERIHPSFLAFKKLIHDMDKSFHVIWDLLLE